MQPHYIEFNGKLFLIREKKEDERFITEILDNGQVIGSIKLETPASEDIIKLELLSKFKGMKELELADD